MKKTDFDKYQEDLKYLLGLDKNHKVIIMDENPRLTKMLVEEKRIKEFCDKLKFWERKKDEDDDLLTR